jgi:hypothetical protein
VLWAMRENSPSSWNPARRKHDKSKGERETLESMRKIVLVEWGRTWLFIWPDHVPEEKRTPLSPDQDIAFYVQAQAKDGEMLDFIEAWLRVVGAKDLQNEFREQVNAILDDEDLAYQIVGVEIVPRESMVMHATVVQPALSLLHGQAGLERVEQAYQNALSEMKPGGDPADAITDAATALQEMLMAKGAEGNALGPLVSDARKRELLGPFDTKLSDAVELLGHWVSANRSERGDAHKVTDADKADAWLAIHVVGALVLRLES